MAPCQREGVGLHGLPYSSLLSPPGTLRSQWKQAPCVNLGQRKSNQKHLRQKSVTGLELFMKGFLVEVSIIFFIAQLRHH